jgi:hypothetical protein
VKQKIRSLIRWLSNRLIYIAAFTAGVVGAVGFKWWWRLSIEAWVQAALRDTRNIDALECLTQAGEEQKVFCLWGPPCGLKSAAAQELAIKNRAVWLDGNRLRNYFEQERKKQSLVNYAVPVLAAELLRRDYHVVIDISHHRAFNRGGSRGIIWALTLGRKLRFVYVRPKVTLQKLKQLAIMLDLPAWYHSVVSKRPEVLVEAISLLKSRQDFDDTAFIMLTRHQLPSEDWRARIVRYAELVRQARNFFNNNGSPKPDPITVEIDVGMWEESRPGIRAMTSAEIDAVS